MHKLRFSNPSRRFWATGAIFYGAAGATYSSSIMASIYVLSGSGSGNLGCYTTLKRAYVRAVEYLKIDRATGAGATVAKVSGPAAASEVKELPATRSNVTLAMDGKSFVAIEKDGDPESRVVIELFQLNDPSSATAGTKL